MRSRDRIPPALKHGAYSATAILPGESQAEFEKLHRYILAEWTPSGVLENDIVMTITRLLWRKQNLDTLHIAEHARRRCEESTNSGEKIIKILYQHLDPEKNEENRRTAEENWRIEEENWRIEEEKRQARIREKFGDDYKLVELGEATTFDGLRKELDIIERLDSAITRCLKQLLLVRGVKSISPAPSSTSSKRISGQPKAA